MVITRNPELAKPDFSTLKNSYFLMRHGNSLANQQGIIVSQPHNGVNEYGLSTLGKQQVLSSIQSATLQTFEIYCSDFKRARETADIVHRTLGEIGGINIDTRLRERNFGQLELGPDNQYQKVWEFDHLDPNHSEFEVESVNFVLDRAVCFVRDLENQFQSQHFLLIAHGDVLQILQTAFEGISAALHRSLAPLETAEIRLVGRHQAIL
ncbi:MAG: broad specificity phosphatase PhoE [Gammaproteobacteria bacterium]|jgi:broad specificity phosphatase PhoE